MKEVYEYVIKNNGIEREDKYEYKGRVGHCNYKSEFKGASITGYKYLPEGDENSLQDAVANIGSISIGIDASTMDFQFYRSGVYVDDEGECKKQIEGLNHGVAIVGYGNEDGQDYWLIKNSWGEVYGDQGYMKMARNNDNQCGVATYASYPTGANI